MKRIITGFVVFFSLYGLHALSQETIKQKTINASGIAEMEVVPDEIYVQVQLREYDKKGGSKIDIESIKNNFLKAATSIGLGENDISVQGYQGWDGNFWWYKKNKKKNPDMKASITYQVKLSSTKKMDELVQKLDDEATENFFISKVSHSKLQEFKKQLKIQAVKSAKEKAIYLADAINEKAGEALTINEPNEINPFPQPLYNNRMMEAKVAMNGGDEQTPNIDFKKMKLQYEVNVVFALK
ncbi:SIMPL domain-containing protein [Segetibacter koreensis]|uniref:SIMPL domain-containing protein n=1 Tax=Segetibacter koreensis TaxID=398037 RepID=UPI000382AC0A|nr:SIMPL domain-containing protein [Segetibacter koreensis]